MKHMALHTGLLSVVCNILVVYNSSMTLVVVYSFLLNFGMPSPMATTSSDYWHRIHYQEYSNDKNLRCLVHGSLHSSALMTRQLPVRRVRTETKRRQKQAAVASVAYYWNSHTLESPLVMSVSWAEDGAGYRQGPGSKTSSHCGRDIIAPRYLQS